MNAFAKSAAGAPCWSVGRLGAANVIKKEEEKDHSLYVAVPELRH